MTPKAPVPRDIPYKNPRSSFWGIVKKQIFVDVDPEYAQALRIAADRETMRRGKRYGRGLIVESLMDKDQNLVEILKEVRAKLNEEGHHDNGRRQDKEPDSPSD